MIEENVAHNLQCKSPWHGKHLCYMISQGFNTSDKEEFEALTKEPQFKCRHCGRTAKSEQNLCEPEKL